MRSSSPSARAAFGSGGRLHRVPAAGGVPAPVTTPDSPPELGHRWPHFLPDGRHFLYWNFASTTDSSGVVLASLDDKPDSKERRHLLPGLSMTVYSAGHLLFEREDSLMAQPFDASRLELHSEAFPLVQQIMGSRRWERLEAVLGLAPDRKLMASAVRSLSGNRSVIEAAAPESLFETRIARWVTTNTFPYSVAADGRRFLVNTSGAEADGEPLSVVVNWLAGVKK